MRDNKIQKSNITYEKVNIKVECKTSILNWLFLLNAHVADINLIDVNINNVPLITQKNFLPQLSEEDKKLPLFYNKPNDLNDIGWYQLDIITYLNAIREKAILEGGVYKEILLQSLPLGLEIPGIININPSLYNYINKTPLTDKWKQFFEEIKNENTKENY